MKFSPRLVLRWFDEHGVTVFAAILILIIPLWPKIPIFSPIEQYIVRVRLEDFVVLAAVLFTSLQLLRKKVRFDKPIALMVGAYAVVGLLSMLSAVFVTQTVPLQPLHLAKTALHFFRYLEYFSVFFVAYAGVRSKADVKLLLKILVTAVVAISIYGYMQKFFYWPVYSTMNREFSKGVRLVLTEFARIQSTFAGHYDMAAYLVVVLPIVLSLGLMVRSLKRTVLLMTAFALGFWLMVMSASRIPFAAILFGVAIVIGLHALVQPSYVKKIVYVTGRSLLFVIFLTTMLYYFGQNMLDRMSNALSTADNPLDINQMIDDVLDPLPLPQSEQLLAWLPKSPALPINSQPAPDQEEALIAQVVSMGDLPPIPANPSPTESITRPRDVYEDIPEPIETEEVMADGSVKRVVIHKTRVYSDCALQHELSLCIRLESLWPWALQSFAANPVFGTGYATLNKQFVDEFTIADSTDNNYLRTLGETGLLGFLTFYGLILYLIIQTSLAIKRSPTRFDRALNIGFLAGTLGLLVNAAYIDVFAASKVAYTYWFFAGLVRSNQSISAAAKMKKKPKNSKRKQKRRHVRH